MNMTFKRRKILTNVFSFYDGVGDVARSSSSSDAIEVEQLSGCSSLGLVSSSSALVRCKDEFVVDVAV